MGVLAAVATVASGAISAIGAIQSANAQAAAAEYNAKIDQRNAAIADANRKTIQQQTEFDVEDKRRENARTLASIRAAYGTSGLDLAGSPLDVIEDTALELNTDLQRVDYEGRMKARDAAMQSQTSRESSVLHKMEAKSAKTAGIISAFGYFTSGVGQGLSQLSTSAAGAM